MSSPSFRVWKGEWVTAKRKAPKTFSKARAVYAPLREDRIFGVDTESLTSCGKLKTLLTPVRFHDRDVMLKSPSGTKMFEALLQLISDEYGEPEKGPHRPSRTAQRPKAERTKRKGYACGRDGRRGNIVPVLAVWFNLPYDFGRLADDRRELLRAVATGSDSFHHIINNRLDLEVSKMIFGSSSSFEWFIRDHKRKSVARVLGIDLRGYWKSSLSAAAKATGGKQKIDIESLIDRVYEKPFEDFTTEEWRLFREYAGVDAHATLDLYHATVRLLCEVDSRVMRRTGVIPQSAPGAAAKIVFAKAFDCHPGITEWLRYPAWADQLGCDSYYGGRSFNARRGVVRPSPGGRKQGVVTRDLKSAYPFQLALLPDPVTLKCIRVKSSDDFEVDDYKGKYGVLRIDGESLDDRYPAFRVHSKLKRLQYVYGSFTNIAVTIPEIVIGVLSGALRVTKIHEGVVMEGSPENSFLRAGIRDFFRIKEDTTLDKALRDMAKLLANATYGKLVEVNTKDYFLGEKLIVPNFVAREDIARAFANIAANETGIKKDDVYLGNTDEQIETVWSEFKQLIQNLDMTGISAEKKQTLKLSCYVAALEHGQVESDGTSTTLSAFLRLGKPWKTGQYFMPLYGAQVTGATSAMLGLMARCTQALQGDTDSSHTVGNVDSGIDEYFQIMKEAGYPSPRLVDGKYTGGIDVPGMENLGAWEIESPAPSVESVLVRPKVYSHLYPDGSYKQARHGFAKFHSPSIEAILRDGSIPGEERGRLVQRQRQKEIHEAMKLMLSGKTVVYDTKSAPRKIREAVRAGTQVGEFVSREMVMTLTPDPNTWEDADGNIRWKRFGWEDDVALAAE